MEEADWVALEPGALRLVAVGVGQPGIPMPLKAAVQGRACQVWDGGLERVKAVVERQSVWRRKATMTASSSIDSTVDLGS